jgi:hypothetical protein
VELQHCFLLIIAKVKNMQRMLINPDNASNEYVMIPSIKSLDEEEHNYWTLLHYFSKSLHSWA